ncbi:MAG TPA: HAD family phosphatase [Pyrinomonadaceae bacterium]|nr:HAD family phosphatase [Pyrinomonadaceae bacterium]
MIKAIFLDFNGVIIDDEPLQLKAYQQVLKEQGIELTSEQYYASMGMDDRAFLRGVFARVNKPLTDDVMNASIERKSELHRGLIEDELPLFPGVVTFLKAAARPYQLGLVSMARRVEIDYVLERARLASLFTVLVSAEEVTKHKPDPESFQLAFDKLNEHRRAHRQLPLLSHECLAIEDAAQGVEAARAVGMRTVGITNTVAEAALRGAGADVVTASLADWTVEAVELVFG